MIDLEQIKAYCTAATKGPWYVVGPPWRMSWYDKERGEYVAVPTYVVAGNPDPHCGTVVITAPDCDEEDARKSYEELVEQTDADLEFAARARQDLPLLIREIERLREALEDIRSTLLDADGFPRIAETEAILDRVLDAEGEVSDG